MSVFTVYFADLLPLGMKANGVGLLKCSSDCGLQCYIIGPTAWQFPGYQRQHKTEQLATRKFSQGICFRRRFSVVLYLINFNLIFQFTCNNNYIRVISFHQYQMTGRLTLLMALRSMQFLSILEKPLIPLTIVFICGSFIYLYVYMYGRNTSRIN